jgi:O-antigen/teichoic acid export membrane protein
LVLPEIIRRSLQLLPHLTLTELFIRVDILTLSLFVDARLLGIYAFFAFIAEGILQLLYGVRVHVIGQMRRLITLISNTQKKQQHRRLSKHINRIRLFSVGIAALGCAGGITFTYLISLFNATPLLYIHVLFILSAGLLVYALIYPFELMFIFLGKPSHQSLFTLILNGVNVSLNFLFIPLYGITGAALATTSSFILGSVLFGYAVRHNFPKLRRY